MVSRSYSSRHFFSSAKQHIRHCVALGGELNPHPKMVETILQPEPGVEKTILDLG